MRLRGAVGAVPRGSTQGKHERETGAPTSKPRKGDGKAQLKSEVETRAWGEAGQGEAVSGGSRPCEQTSENPEETNALNTH